MAFAADARGDETPERREKLVVAGYLAAFIVAYREGVDDTVYHVCVKTDLAQRRAAGSRITGRERNHVAFQVYTLAVLGAPADVALRIDGAIQVVVQFAPLGKRIQEIPQQCRVAPHRLKIQPGVQFRGRDAAVSGNDEQCQEYEIEGSR